MTTAEYLAHLRGTPEGVLNEILTAPLPWECPSCGRGVCTVKRSTKNNTVTEERQCVVCRHRWTTTRGRFA